jgi:hypothetical protein
MARICEWLGSRSVQYFRDISPEQNHVPSTGSRVHNQRGYEAAQKGGRCLLVPWYFATFTTKIIIIGHYVWNIFAIYTAVNQLVILWKVQQKTKGKLGLPSADFFLFR